MPFCGYGDIAARMDCQNVRACDTDPERVARFAARFPSATVCVSAAERFHFGTETYSHLDLDAYRSPYAALERAIRNARLADTFTVALTDGTRQDRVRKGMFYRFADHATVRDRMRARSQDEIWWKAVRAWMRGLGFSGRAERIVTSKWMVYAGLGCVFTNRK